MSNKPWLSVIFFLAIVQLGLISFIYFQYFNRRDSLYFAKPPTGDAFSLSALDRPNVSTSALLSWATLAVSATFTFDFVNYQDQLKALKDYFTNRGYDDFVTSLDAAGTIKEIDAKKLVLTAVPIGSAIITSETDVGLYHTWQIQVPILVRYQSANTNETRVKLVSLLVTQVPTKEAPKGIGISQYISTDAGPDYAG